MKKVILTIEAALTFDTEKSVPKVFHLAAIRDEIESAIAGCSQIENVASVQVIHLGVKRDGKICH